MMQRFPWDELMRLGIGTFHIAPRDFWNCTLRELVGLRTHSGIARNTLEELMRDWPDE